MSDGYCMRGPIVAMIVMGAAAWSTSAIANDAQDASEAPATIEVESGNPLSGDPDAVAAGRKLYVRWCQQCHGVKLDGYSPRWGQHGADLRRFWRGYDEFLATVLGGRADKMMPPFGQYIPVEDINKIGAFIETKAIEGANWK